MHRSQPPRGHPRTHANAPPAECPEIRAIAERYPYSSLASRYFRMGLLPIPCGGADGKRPLIKYGGSAAPTFDSLVANLGDERLSEANIGILTGAGTSPVTVVDIDDAALVPGVLMALGDTPVRVRTPSGGTHLYFRYVGERSTNLRPRLPIDIKGAGGFVVVPPSVRRRSGNHDGGVYRFEAGDMRLLGKPLPPLPEDWHQRLEQLAAQRPTAAQAPPAVRGRDSGGHIPKGARNDTLFRAGLHIAPRVGSAAELAEVLNDINRLQCETPLPDAEVKRSATSAWSYQERGRNWVQANGVFQITAEELKLIESGDALRLLAHLRIAHGSRAEPFAVAVRAMAEHESIPGMGETALRSAREHLVQRGFIRCVHAGGRWPGDAAKFILTQPAIPCVGRSHPI